MSMRALLIVAIGAVLLAALALYGHNRSTMTATSSNGTLFLPELKSALKDVTKIQVEKGGSEVVATLTRTDQGWKVDERSGYPADVAKIRKALIDLSEAKVIEQKTSDPAFYDRLGVAPINLAKAGGTALTISAPKNAPPAIILGGTEGSKYRYARLADQKQSYLLDRNPEVPRDTAQWLQADILDVRGTRVRQVTISHADGETLRISKENTAQTNFSVADVPKGRELQYPGVADVIGNSLRELKLQDVMAAGDDATAPQASAEFRTFDGLIVTAKGIDRDGKSWVAFQASVDPQLLPAADTDKGATADADKDDERKKTKPSQPAQGENDAPKKTAADIRTEAEAINSRVSGWLYQIPSYQYEQMTRRIADLLKAEKAKSKTAD